MLFRSIVLALLCAAGNVAAALYIPILVGKAVDAIVGPGQVVFAAVASIGLEIAELALLGAAAQWVMNVVNNRIVFCVTRDTRAEAFAHLQKLPLSYLDSHPSGDVISRMIADVDQFADDLLMGFTQLFTGVLTILGTLGIMFYLNWKITLVVVVLTPLSLFAAKFIASRTYNMFREQSQSRGEQTAFLNEMVDGQKVVQAFGYEPRAEARFGALNEALRRASLRDVLLLADEPGHALCHQRGLRLCGPRRRDVRRRGRDHGRRPDGFPQLCQPVCQAV